MENNYNDKELDRWLREKAGAQDATPADDGWDSPSDSVWTGVRRGLDRRKKRRSWFLLLGIGLLLGLAGSGIVYWIQRAETAAPSAIASETTTLPAQSGASLTTVPKTDIKVETSTNHTAINTNSLPPAGTTTTQHPAGSPARSVRSTSETASTSAINPRAISDHLPEEKIHPTSTAQTADAPSSDALGTDLTNPGVVPSPHEAIAAPTTEPGAIPAVASFEKTAPIPPLSALAIPGLHWDRATPFNVIETKPLRSSQTHWYAGAQSGLFFTSRKLKNAGIQAPNGQESGAWTWQQGLQVGFKLNRHWAIETGLQRSSIRLQAERQVQFQYRTDRERFNPDRFIYQNSSDQQVQTSFGEVEMRMDLSREPSRPIANDALLKLNLYTDEQVHYLRVPLLLRWSSGTGQLQWSLSSGLGISFENGYDLSLTAARSDRPGVRDISARAKRQVNGLAPITLDAQFSAGVQLRFAPKWSARLAPEFRYGLSSMYRNGPFQSLAISGGLQFGIFYDFK